MDKSGSVSPNVRLRVPAASLFATRRPLPQEEIGTAALETDLQLAAETT